MNLKAALDMDASGIGRKFVDADGKTALMVAALHDHSDCLKLLLYAPKKRGSDNFQVYETSNDGTTVLMWAVIGSSEESVRELLRAGADVSVYGPKRITALFLASRLGLSSIAKILLDAGADIEAQNADGATPLLAAVSNGHEECTVLLLEYNANLKHKDKVRKLLT